MSPSKWACPTPSPKRALYRSPLVLVHEDVLPMQYQVTSFNSNPIAANRLRWYAQHVRSAAKGHVIVAAAT